MDMRRKEAMYSVLFVVSVFTFAIVVFVASFKFSKGGNPQDVENMLLRLHGVAALDEDLMTNDGPLRFGTVSSTGRTEAHLILLDDTEGNR